MGELADRRILVVEDEALIAWDIEATVARAGGAVIGPAMRLDHAFELIALDHLDAAVLDISIAGEPVFAVADALAGAGVPFLFVTGRGLDTVPERFSHVPVLAKPHDPRALVRELALRARS